MRFIKGMIIGGIVTAGVTMMYKDEINMNKSRRKMMKKGRQIIKKMGII